MDPYIIGSVSVVSLIGWSYYKGWVGIVTEWIGTRHSQVKLLLALMSKLRTDPSKGSNTTPSFVLSDSDTSAQITYDRLDQRHIITVPYERKYVAAMSQFKAELLRQDNVPLDITQQPGIPYLISPFHLGGHTIRVTNQETRRHVDYVKMECPMYAETLMETE